MNQQSSLFDILDCECPTCHGEGRIWVKDASLWDDQWVECPDCEGDLDFSETSED